MESTRQQKIARMLQKELGNIFLPFAKEMQGTLITVTEVRISPDLAIAKIFLSVFPTEKSEMVLQFVSEKQKSIRFELGQKVKLRIVPELQFFIDGTMEELAKIDQLLKK
ncbi:MAG: 30S ribosome-binding factor RbfA [Paludibacteraceae bacterium]|nr:30S ribosome-binding factor RbfA [Paludibacteraceae bacterium]MBO7316165.1 30S ribosome-binding factor RbfA [Paludibacteraceae bacterium]